MQKIITALTLTAIASSVSAEPPPQAQAAGYNQIIFFDDFKTLDLSEDGGGHHRWFNTLWLRNQVDPKLFAIKGGVLKMTTPLEPREQVLTTAITTMPRRGPGTPSLFRYGYFEARMKYQPGPYAWPAFWLLAAERMRLEEKIGKGHWCEIDIFEGGRPTHFQGTVHDWVDFKSKSNSNQHFRLPAGSNLQRWNTFGVLWTESTITWFFNDKPLGSAPTPEICRKQDVFMIAGAQKRKLGPEAESLSIDWIRVYR